MRRFLNVGHGSSLAWSSTKRQASSLVKQLKLEKAESPLVVEEVKPGKLKEDQVRIKVRNVAVNAPDILLSRGRPAGDYKLPLVPGYEISGTVIESSSEDFLKGDKVVALNKETLGGFASECIASGGDVWHKPGNLSFDKAVAVADSFGTALLGLDRVGRLKEKQTVLATMAQAHGFAAVDLASRVYKAKVIAVCLTEKDADNLRERGAWSALVYKETSVLAAVNELTAGKGVDIVYDTLGGDALQSALKCVKHEGKIIVAGYAMKELPPLQMSILLSLPSFSLTGVSLISYRKHSFPVYRQTISDVLEMAGSGLISPEIAARFPLEQANEALDYIKNERPIGKVILDVSEDV